MHISSTKVTRVFNTIISLWLSWLSMIKSSNRLVKKVEPRHLEIFLVLSASLDPFPSSGTWFVIDAPFSAWPPFHSILVPSQPRHRSTTFTNDTVPDSLWRLRPESTTLNLDACSKSLLLLIHISYHDSLILDHLFRKARIIQSGFQFPSYAIRSVHDPDDLKSRWIYDSLKLLHHWEVTGFFQDHF